MKIGKWFGLFAWLGLVLCPLHVYSSPTITSRVSANELTIDDSLTLAVEVAGVNNVQPPQQLNIPDFQVQSAGRTQSFQWINGQTSAMVTFNYVLTPNRIGTLTIPSIQMPIENQVLQTQPITIVVKPSGSKPSNSGAVPAPQNEGGSGQAGAVPTEGLRPVFMTANVDKSKAYVGEQILFTVQFLRRTNVALASQPRYVEPEMTGFVVEPIKQQEFTTNLNGIPYMATELRYALFPTSDGEFALGNAAIDVRLQTPWDPFDPNNFFQNFFNQGQSMRLTTRAIPLQIRSLPKNKPDNFMGAVGRYKITAKVDKTEVEVGKPFNLLVRIDGTGNIKALREPQWPEMKSFRRYETLTETKINNEGKFIYGYKEFKVLLIPQVSGFLNIPPISFTYFNASDHRYITDATNPISLQVKPGTLTTDSTNPPSLNEDQRASEGIRVVEKDIRFIKKGHIHSAHLPIASNLSFWVINLIPPLFTIAAAFTTFRIRRRLERPDYYRSKEALNQAKQIIRQAKKRLALGDSNGFYGSLFSALTEYIAGKLGMSASALIWSDVEIRLKEKGVDESLLKQAREIWDESDMARFGIGSFSPEEKLSSFKRTESVLTALNKIL